MFNEHFLYAQHGTKCCLGTESIKLPPARPHPQEGYNLIDFSVLLIHNWQTQEFLST